MKHWVFEELGTDFERVMCLSSWYLGMPANARIHLERCAYMRSPSHAHRQGGNACMQTCRIFPHAHANKHACMHMTCLLQHISRHIHRIYCIYLCCGYSPCIRKHGCWGNCHTCAHYCMHTSSLERRIYSLKIHPSMHANFISDL